MTAVWSHLPILIVVIPLFGALLAGLSHRAGTAFALALVVSWLMPFCAGGLLWQVSGDPARSPPPGSWAPPWGIEYRVDLLNAFVLLLVSTVGAVIMPFARRSIAFEIEEGQRAWFYCMYLLCLTGLLDHGDRRRLQRLLLSRNPSLSTYVLIALGRDRRALLAAFQYLIMGTIGATIYVIGVGLLYPTTGSLNMVDIAARLGPAWADNSRAIIAALAFVTVGLSLKLALFPLHVWLPTPMPMRRRGRPPSVGHGDQGRDLSPGALSLLDLRRCDRPSRSAGRRDHCRTIARRHVHRLPDRGVPIQPEPHARLFFRRTDRLHHARHRFVNLAWLTGGLVHIVHHASMKSAWFLAVGAIFFRVRTVRLSELAGIGRKMLITMAASTVACFGLVGTPGTSGFVSNGDLALGAIENGWWVVVFLIVASSLIALVYVGRVLEVAWLREPSAAFADANDPPLSMLLPLILLAAATIYFGFDTEWTAGIADTAARARWRAAMTAAFPLKAILVLALLAPFVGALILPLFHKHPNLRETGTLVTATALCLIVLGLLGPVLNGARPELGVIDVVPGLTIAFEVEPLGMLFALVASSLWIVNSVYSIGYMRANNEPRQTTFYVCFAVALGSTIGIAFAKNLFTLFLFYEALTLSTYPLVTHKRNEEAVRAGRIYLCCCSARPSCCFCRRSSPPGFSPDARFQARRHFPGRYRRACPGRAAPALRVRHRQGGGDAVAFLAACRDGGADACQRIAACRAVVKAGVFSILKWRCWFSAWTPWVPQANPPGLRSLEARRSWSPPSSRSNRTILNAGSPIRLSRNFRMLCLEWLSWLHLGNRRRDAYCGPRPQQGSPCSSRPDRSIPRRI